MPTQPHTHAHTPTYTNTLAVKWPLQETRTTPPTNSVRVSGILGLFGSEPELLFCFYCCHGRQVFFFYFPCVDVFTTPTLIPPQVGEVGSQIPRRPTTKMLRRPFFYCRENFQCPPNASGTNRPAGGFSPTGQTQTGKPVHHRHHYVCASVHKGGNGAQTEPAPTTTLHLDWLKDWC